MSERSDLTRLSINMNLDTKDALQRLASEQGISYTEAIRRAISIWAFVEDNRSRGAKLITREGNLEREVILL